jgi:GntR family transcriptional repressor for pyruvate dehydrogenase complex
MTLYRPIALKKAADLVFEQIRDLIFRGQLKPGDQLPPEREMAESMGVSRPIIREAIGKLVHLGLVESHQGQGTFVRTPSDDQSRNPLSFIIDGETVVVRNLLEVRLGLECQAAVLAARRATEEDIELLEKSVQMMRDQISAGAIGHQEDVFFHMRIAYATKNPVWVQLMKHFYDLFRTNVRENLEHLYVHPQNKDVVNSHHEKILESIKNRDTKAAFDSMYRHIHFVMDFFETQSA